MNWSRSPTVWNKARLSENFPNTRRSPEEHLLARRRIVDSHTTVCYNPDNLNNRVLPDLYFAFDVDPQAIRRRKLYLPWEAGKPPDFALEIGSESTFQNDMGHKRDLYAQIGISEYWRFDPTGGTYYNQPLTGEQLINGPTSHSN